MSTSVQLYLSQSQMLNYFSSQACAPAFLRICYYTYFRTPSLQMNRLSKSILILSSLRSEQFGHVTIYNVT